MPTAETRNRKRMRPNPLASHRLRIGKLSVYYDVEEAARVVTVRAVAIKLRDRVLFAGKEIRL
jgi:hypothetical protein